MRHESSLAICALFIAGCARYQADHRSYATPAGALAAFDERTREITDGLQPRDAPLATSARVVVPSRDVFVTIASQGGSREDIVDYVASVNERFVDSFVEAMRRRALFPSLLVSQTSDVEDPAPSDDLTLWFTWLHRQQAGWWIRKGTRRRWVSIDMAQTDRAAQLTSGLRGIEQAVEIVVR